MHIKNSDRHILNALKQNGRIPISDLARQLNISRTTAQHRLKQLEKKGVILGYTVKLGDQSVSGGFEAYVNLVVDPPANASVSLALEKIPEVQALFTVSGKIDFVAIIRVFSPVELDAVLDKICALKGVKETRSALVLASKFDRR